VIAGITFENPVGLAAGFDYKAELTQILPALGFGFETIGTITNESYEGNPLPRLGRLPKSRSLFVNKGFKNEGIDAILKKLHGSSFQIPIGLSIGKTNRPAPMTQEEAVHDVTRAFEKAEHSDIPFAYYELNISCPNLHGSVSFYPPENLDELLKQIGNLHPQKPIFIKMPITQTDDEVRAMLQVITTHPIAGVIFGNLQKDRNHPGIRKDELLKFEGKKGNFSGKPTWDRSNELIRLAYREQGRKLVIIGCGGVMSPEDAYKKIQYGASLVQLVSGLVFEGPSLVARITHKLPALLHRDGFASIRDAIGSRA
jgi:dihydroorotate dehydrogenase subfamily 2